MKKLLGFAMLAIFFCCSSYAQTAVDKAAHGVKTGANKAWQGTKKGANKAWKGTKKGAKKVGNKSAELGTTAKAKVTDKKSSDWTGPEGQTIYVDDASKYYWINGQGKRIFVSQAALKARSKN